MNQIEQGSRLKPMASMIALALLALTNQSHAQEQAQAPQVADAGPTVATANTASNSDSNSGQLQSIVVSANKRVEKLESVPMAISVMTDAALKRNNVVELQDVIYLQPALTMSYSTGPANFGINMRGVGTSSIGVGVEADVVTVIDDIPSSAVQFKALTDLADISRIEILKGPQSTLFGKAAIAGAINIVTTPVGGPLQGTGTSYYTTDGEWRLGASYGGQLDDHWAFRVSALDERYPGNELNTYDNMETNGYGGKTFRAKVKWAPTDNLTFDLSSNFNHELNSCCAYAITSMNETNSYLLGVKNPAMAASVTQQGIVPSGTNTNIYNDIYSGLESTDRGLGLKSTLDMADGSKLMLISSYDIYLANDSRDQDFAAGNIGQYIPISAPANSQALLPGSKTGQPAGTVGALANYGQFGTYDVRSKTEELRWVSPDAGDFRYVAGLFYGKNDIGRMLTRGIYETATSPIAYEAFDVNTNEAVFGQATWEFVPTWTALAGVRFGHEVSGSGMAFYNPFTSSPAGPAGIVPCPTAKSVGCGFQGNGVPGGLNPDGNSDSFTSGKLSLQHQFTSDVMGYAMVSDGYKGKAYDVTSGLGAVENALEPVAAETARNEEIGAKANLLNNRWTISADIFNTNFRNYQQSETIYLADGTSLAVLHSLPKVNTRGFELDTSAMVTKTLLIDFGFAWTRATVKDWTNGTCATGTGRAVGSVVGTCDDSGGMMPNAPMRKANVGGQLDIPMANYSFDQFVSFDTRVQSSVFTNIDQDPGLKLPGYGITNLGYGLKDKNKKYTLSFFLNNVFNHQYTTYDAGGLGSTYKTFTGTGTATVNTPSTSWVPARDAFRYGGVRLDVKF